MIAEHSWSLMASNDSSASRNPPASRPTRPRTHPHGAQVSRRQTLRNHRNAYDNQPIRTVVVKNWQKEDVLYLIFDRAQQRKPTALTARTPPGAHTPGPFLRYAAEYTQAPAGIHKALGIGKLDFRMRGVELFVRSRGHCPWSN